MPSAAVIKHRLRSLVDSPKADGGIGGGIGAGGEGAGGIGGGIGDGGDGAGGTGGGIGDGGDGGAGTGGGIGVGGDGAGGTGGGIGAGAGATAVNVDNAMSLPLATMSASAAVAVNRAITRVAPSHFVRHIIMRLLVYSLLSHPSK
jgi:hypothetical protein